MKWLEDLKQGICSRCSEDGDLNDIGLCMDCRQDLGEFDGEFPEGG